MRNLVQNNLWPYKPAAPSFSSNQCNTTVIDRTLSLCWLSAILLSASHDFNTTHCNLPGPPSDYWRPPPYTWTYTTSSALLVWAICTEIKFSWKGWVCCCVTLFREFSGLFLWWFWSFIWSGTWCFSSTAVLVIFVPHLNCTQCIDALCSAVSIWLYCNLFRYWSEHAHFAITTHRNVSPKMAASGLERDDGGLKIEPNFELLALLLALALQGEDAERFLEVYDNIVPKSLSVCEVRKKGEFGPTSTHSRPSHYRKLQNKLGCFNFDLSFWDRPNVGLK